MKVTITSNAEAVARATAELGRGATPAIRRALERTLLNLRTELAKQIKERVNLKAADIKDALDIRKPTNADLKAVLEVLYANKDGDKGRGAMPLKRFGARPTRKGVTVEILRGTGRRVARGAFAPKKVHPRAEDLGGHTFERFGPKKTASKGRYKGKQRQPIRKRYGPSILTQATPILEKLRADGWIDDALTKNLQHEINYALEKRAKAGGET